MKTIVNLHGINSPFEDGCLKHVVDHVDNWLKDFNITNM